jgi:hypothetical protein
MHHIDDTELTNKIHSFMERKMAAFPELQVPTTTVAQEQDNKNFTTRKLFNDSGLGFAVHTLIGTF